MEDTVEGKEFNFAMHYNLVHKFISILQRMNIPDAKTAVIMEWKNPWDIIIVQLGEKKKYSELDPQFQKYKGKDILQGDIVKGDSGACAVFTE